MLPHHRQTSPAELKNEIRTRPRHPVFPHHRLSKARGWNLPIPEALFLITGLIMQHIEPSLLSEINRLGGAAATAGWSGLIVGIPLLFIPLRIFWFDLAYIIAGQVIYSYMMTLIDGSYIFLGLVPIICMGMMLSGASCLVRRAIAHHFALKRVSAVESRTE